ncbi:MAG: Thioredoxin [Chlamydiia bacterium]|nr:Thioredoxin [Chlamydiia bacterium]MCH9618416.1 Thioredoxin [Chlamydiia bacterium]MCH9623742.1 Thioredoxin [Chlamydiia bacterium]
MSVKELNQSEFEEAIGADEVVVVDFYAEWCGPCKMLKPILEEVSNENVTVYSVNVDENKDLSTKYQISSIPTVLLFKGGKQIDQFVGLKEKEEILALVKGHA